MHSFSIYANQSTHYREKKKNYNYESFYANDRWDKIQIHI